MADEWGDDDAGDDWGDDAAGDDDWGGDGDGAEEWAEGGDEVEANADANAEVTWDINVENLFYSAESDIRDDPAAALTNFIECARVEEENSPKKVTHRFNALKNVVTILFAMGAEKREEMVSQYEKLLSISSLDGVSPNDLNSAIRFILNKMQQSTTAGSSDSLQKMYAMTLAFFKNVKGKERVWFEFAMRLCKSLLESQKNSECEVLLDELHASCKLANGSDDPQQGGPLLEIYSIKIQLMAAANNRVALAELFERTNSLAADVNDPRSMSVIKECWGKMYASMNQWNEAYTNFYEAFRSYQDIGHANVKQCLKYVVIASMLSEEDTNPFASQEAAVFKTNNDIMPMANLLDAFDEDDIKRFERTLLQSRATILGDPFIKEHLPAVKLRIRSKVLVKLIKPYTRVKLEWLCRQLNATMAEIENLVVNLILDKSINGRLDQIHSLLDLNYSEKADQLYGAMDTWISSVGRLRNSISSRTGRSDMGGGRGMGGMAHFGGGMMDFDDDLYGSQFGIGDSDFLQWMG